MRLRQTVSLAISTVCSWRDSNGNIAMWLMNGGAIASNIGVGGVDTAWIIQSANAN